MRGLSTKGTNFFLSKNITYAAYAAYAYAKAYDLYLLTCILLVTFITYDFKFKF